MSLAHYDVAVIACAVELRLLCCMHLLIDVARVSTYCQSFNRDLAHRFIHTLSNAAVVMKNRR